MNNLDLTHVSLEDANLMYQRGMIGYETTRDYVRKWNAGPHFTQAIIWDGKIKNMDPDLIHIFHPRQEIEFEVRR